MAWWLRVLALAQDPSLVHNTLASWVTATDANCGGQGGVSYPSLATRALT